MLSGFEPRWVPLDFRMNYITLRYFDNNLSRTSKKAEIYFVNCILMK